MTELASDGLVTVIVPCYNAGRFIGDTLASLVDQTYHDIEILVVDDASTDNTGDIVRSFEPRIRYQRQPANLGQFRNVNAGIGMATGEWIAVFHADDVYDPRIVERAVAVFRDHPQVGAVFCIDVFVNEAGREYSRLILPTEFRGGGVFGFRDVFNSVLLRKNSILRTPGAIVRASAYRELGGYRPEFGTAADLEMWLRIVRRYPIAILDEYLFRYRHRPSSEARRYERLRTEPSEYFRIIDEYLDAGGRAVAWPRALRAYEAHRAEDLLMNAISCYIMGDLDLMRTRLRDFRWRSLVGSRAVQRWRLSALFGFLWALARAPRIDLVGRIFRKRWHSK